MSSKPRSETNWSNIHCILLWAALTLSLVCQAFLIRQINRLNTKIDNQPEVVLVGGGFAFDSDSDEE